MPSLELKIPPPLVAAVVAGAMVAAALWLPPVLEVPYGVRLGGALVLAGAGACFDLAGLRAFRKAHTTINPLRPDRAAAVVTTGVYRVTRNPMYLGLVLILLGLALYLAFKVFPKYDVVRDDHAGPQYEFPEEGRFFR